MIDQAVEELVSGLAEAGWKARRKVHLCGRTHYVHANVCMEFIHLPLSIYIPGACLEEEVKRPRGECKVHGALNASNRF